MMKTISLLAAILIATPAASQSGAQFDVMDAGLAGTLAICTGVINGSFDLNDPTALAQYKFVPASAEEEAKVREQNPGIELAIARLAGGNVLVGGKSGHLCMVEVQGEFRNATRDELSRELFETGARNDQSTTDGGVVVRTFHFTTHTIEIQTAPNGGVYFVVKGPT